MIIRIKLGIILKLKFQRVKITSQMSKFQMGKGEITNHKFKIPKGFIGCRGELKRSQVMADRLNTIGD